MMNKKFLAVLFLLPLTSSLLSPQVSFGGPEVDPAWKEKMQKLNNALVALITDVSSDQRYYDPKSKKRIEQEIQTLSSFAHDLGKKNSTPSKVADPTLELFSGFLASETNEAYRAFREGQREYARSLLKSVPSDCLACHSRNSFGPDLANSKLEPTAPLLPVERAEFFAATRQFDRAVDAFQSAIRGEGKAITDPYDIEKSVQEALLIAVRFKRDPNLAKAIVQTAIDSKKSPQFIKEDLTHWKQSIDAWLAETPRTLNTEEGLYAEAMRLIARAKEDQNYPMDHSADITYLRASTVLYDLLQNAPHGKHVGEALMLEGMCYEVLSPRRMENLNNIYYEACIKQSPHTPIAQTCYRRYEQSIYFGFTGSSGTHLPEDIRKKLLELWSNAMPEKGEL